MLMNMRLKKHRTFIRIDSYCQIHSQSIETGIMKLFRILTNSNCMFIYYTVYAIVSILHCNPLTQCTDIITQ